MKHPTKVLIILAHPKPETSFCGAITHALFTKYSKYGAVQCINIYDQKWQQPYFALLKDVKDPVQLEAQKLISWAEHIVWVHPLWWGGMPAVLKNFIDSNITSGFAFKHEYPTWLPQRLRLLPKKLLKPRTSSVWITGDGQWWVYAFMFFPFLIIWALFIMIYIGLRPTGLHYIGGVKFRSETNKKNLLEKIART
jgi:NAD(P)H dehydrogenase (quinone)